MCERMANLSPSDSWGNRRRLCCAWICVDTSTRLPEAGVCLTIYPQPRYLTFLNSHHPTQPIFLSPSHTPPSRSTVLYSSLSRPLDHPPITYSSHPPPNLSDPAMDFTKGFSTFGKNISSTISPFASRTQQFVREQLGQVEDKVSAPPAPGASDGPSDGPTDAASSSASSDTITPTSATTTTIPDTTSSAPDVSPTYAATATATVTATATAVASATTASTRRLAELLNETGLLFMIRRKLTETKTQLPLDYIELEKRVDALKQVHQQLLAVTYVSSQVFNRWVSRADGFLGLSTLTRYGLSVTLTSSTVLTKYEPDYFSHMTTPRTSYVNPSRIK